MRPRLIGSLLAFTLAASLSMAPQVQAAPVGARECTVATTGYERPEWFCRFYAAGPIDYTAAAASGWTIRRLIKQYNNGTTEFEELAGMKASANNGVPLDAKRGRLETQEGWYIEIAVLASTFRGPDGTLRVYRDGAIDARS